MGSVDVRISRWGLRIGSPQPFGNVASTHKLGHLHVRHGFGHRYDISSNTLEAKCHRDPALQRKPLLSVREVIEVQLFEREFAAKPAKHTIELGSQLPSERGFPHHSQRPVSLSPLH
jgi:hypothetical protein